MTGPKRDLTFTGEQKLFARPGELQISRWGDLDCFASGACPEPVEGSARKDALFIPQRFGPTPRHPADNGAPNC
jgi:hypothetical protein